MISQIYLFSLVLISILKSQYFVFGDSAHPSCNTFDVCLPGAEDIAVPPRVITASNTCGNDDKYKEYCIGSSCHNCDSSSPSERHPPHFMIDRSNLTTWWQSQTWWQWYDSLKADPLPVNITLSFNKSYVISGEIRVFFRSIKPSKMVIEKSADFGKTWKPLQYFADDCNRRYNMQPSLQNCSINQVLCSEKYSDGKPGAVYFSFLNCYKADTFWDRKTQVMTNATDLRLRLDSPYLDGRETIKSKSMLNQYFYAISDIQVFGRCQCNGHAHFCVFNNVKMNTPRCQCKHDTTGTDCEKCLPLYNNKTWMPATSNQSNACEKCECYNHAESCVFNASLGHGVCENCQHNTIGYFCQQCQGTFYQNFSKALDDPDICLDCNCSVAGITNTSNGRCSQNQSNAGQCWCKQNVTGLRCDRCDDTYYGYTVPPIGNCVACHCNMHGAINGSLNCNQTTGQCTCKPNVDLRTCSQCKLGFYAFPNATENDCLECSCDPGGSTEDICEKMLGKCLCRSGVEGKTCSNVTTNQFFPQFDYYRFEAEYQQGTYQLISNATAFNKYFTGQGYAKITKNNGINFNISVGVDGNYFLVLRYSQAFGNLNVKIQGDPTSNCPTIDKGIMVTGLSNSQGMAWILNETLTLCSNNTYSIQVSKENPSNNFSVSVDSIVLLPKLNHLRAYTQLDSSTIERCLDESRKIERPQSFSSCRTVTFSNMIEFFDGSLACKCSSKGSKNETCEPYGGQCFCKPGVMGRTCDRCQPGYYNLTNDGCSPCNCDRHGTKELSVCDTQSGQCHCKYAVKGRTCSNCNTSYFGINTGKGCVPCKCNETGAKNSSCDIISGKCYCKPGVEDKTTDKCDKCKRYFFNFTKEGCQACSCNKSGSRSLQCHSTSGECACKDNTNGKKCNNCKNGTFGLEESNPSGCTPCFCFNRTQQCSSAQQFVLSTIEQFNLTVKPDSYKNLSPKFLGNRLSSYGRLFEMGLIDFNMSVQITLHLTGSRGNAIFNLNSSNCKGNKTRQYCVQLHDKIAQNKLNANKLQSILVDLKTISLKLSGGKLVNISRVAMGTANKNVSVPHTGEVVHVEQCDCPENYESGNQISLSCELCNEQLGYTRAIKLNSSVTQSSRSFTNCVLCSCNNRSKKCDPETRYCKECELSHGESCETCNYGVDNETECTECRAGFWSENIKEYGCQDCNCVLNNTLYHNSSICNVTTGQCTCETYVQGGLRCERCADNYFNTSYGCKECPECYGLLQRHVKKLREVRKNLKSIVDNFESDRYQIFGESFNQAINDTNAIYNKAKYISNDTNRNELNHFLEAVEILKQNVSDLLDKVNDTEQGVRRLDAFLADTKQVTQEAYSLLKKVNSSLSVAKDWKKLIREFASPLLQTKTNLAQLNKALWNNTSGNTSVTESELLLEKMSDVVKKASSAQSDVVRQKEKTIPRLQNESQNIFTKTNIMKNDTLKHLKNADDILSNTESVLKTGQELAASIGKRNISIENIQLNKTKQYLYLENNVSGITENVHGELKRASHVLSNSEELLTNATNVQNQANKAKYLAKQTLEDVHETLDILREFRNLSKHAGSKAEKSLQEIYASNTSSWSSINTVKNVSKSVKDALSIANEAVKVAKDADNLTRIENQAIAAVHSDSENKSQKIKNQMVCSKNLMETFRDNVTVRFEKLESLKQCPKNETTNVFNTASSTRHQNDRQMKKAIDTEKEVQKIYEKILKTIDEVKGLETAEISKTLKNRIGNQKLTFDKMQEALKKIRVAKEGRDIYIKQLKEKLKTVKLEIVDVKILRDSLREIPPCS